MTNRAMAVTLLLHHSNEHCAVVHVAHGDTDLYVISAYFQYSHDIGRHIAHLENVINLLSGKPIIIGVDSNAHSLIWHCDRRQYTGRGPDTEWRRRNMEGFILGMDLLLHNVSGQPPIFSGPNGSSNVDLTISTRGSTCATGRCTRELASATISSLRSTCSPVGHIHRVSFQVVCRRRSGNVG